MGFYIFPMGFLLNILLINYKILYLYDIEIRLSFIYTHNTISHWEKKQTKNINAYDNKRSYSGTS